VAADYVLEDQVGFLRKKRQKKLCASAGYRTFNA